MHALHMLIYQAEKMYVLGMTMAHMLMEEKLGKLMEEKLRMLMEEKMHGLFHFHGYAAHQMLIQNVAALWWVQEH